MSESIYQDGKYLEDNPDWHAADAPFKAGWIQDILVRNNLEFRTMAEVGCGSGEILVELQKRNPMSTFAGYDISPQAHAINMQKVADGLQFKQMDFIQSETPKTDVLLVIDVFEHVEDYMAFVRALKNKAKYKIFHIPLDISVQGMTLGTSIMHARRTLGHLHYFYKDTALATLTDCGYDIVDFNYTHGAETLPNRKLKTKLLNIVRKLVRSLNEDAAVRLLGGASILVLAK